MNRKRLALVITFIVALLLFILCVPAQAGRTLTLPDSLEIIEDEAFYGDTSLESVVLPEGIERIGNRAFANSSVAEINFPDSLTYIADSAFSGVSQVYVSAESGSYGYNWARGKSNLTLLTYSLSLRKEISYYYNDRYYYTTEGDRYDVYAYIQNNRGNITDKCRLSDFLSYWYDDEAHFALWSLGSNRYFMESFLYDADSEDGVRPRYVLFEIRNGKLTALLETDSPTASTFSSYGVTLKARSVQSRSYYFSTRSQSTALCYIDDVSGVDTSSALSYGEVSVLHCNSVQPAFEGQTINLTLTARNGSAYQWQYRSSGSGSWTNASYDGSKTSSMSANVTSTHYSYEWRCKMTGMDGNTVYSETIQIVRPATSGADPYGHVTASVSHMSSGEKEISINAYNSNGLLTDHFSVGYPSSDSEEYPEYDDYDYSGGTVRLFHIGGGFYFLEECSIREFYNDGRLAGRYAYYDSSYLFYHSGDQLIKVIYTAYDGCKCCLGYFTDLLENWEDSADLNRIFRNYGITGITFSDDLSMNYGGYIGARTGIATHVSSGGTLIFSIQADTAVNAVLITQQPASQYGVLNQTVNFSVETLNAESYQWQYRNKGEDDTKWKNIANTPGCYTNKITISISGTRLNYEWRCAVTGKGKTLYSEAVCILTPVSKITLNKTSLSMNKGELITLTPAVSPTSAYDQTVTWLSSNTSVALVDGNGVVTGVNAGTCTITALANDSSGVSASCILQLTKVMS